MQPDTALRQLLARIERELTLAAARQAAALDELGTQVSEHRVGANAQPLEPNPTTSVAGPALSTRQLIAACLQRVQLLLQLKLALRRKRKLSARLSELRREVGQFGAHKLQLIGRQRQALPQHGAGLGVAEARDERPQRAEKFSHVALPDGHAGRPAILPMPHTPAPTRRA